MDGDVGHQIAVPRLSRQQGDIADDAPLGHPDEAVGQARRGRIHAIEHVANLYADVVAQQLAVIEFQRRAEDQLQQIDDLGHVARHVNGAQALIRSCIRDSNGHSVVLSSRTIWAANNRPRPNRAG